MNSVVRACLLGCLVSAMPTCLFGQDDDARTINQRWSRGFAEFESGNFVAARRQIEKVVKLVPYEPSSRILLARCQAKLNDRNGAIANLKKAGELGWEDRHFVEIQPEFDGMIDTSEFKQLLSAMDENRRQPFVLYVGKSVEPAKPAPLIVLYHGRGELPNIQTHFWKDAVDQAGCILLALKGTRKVGSVYAWERANANHTWEVDTQAILSESNLRIREVSASYQVSAVILAGFSQGGVAAMDMLDRAIQPQPAGAVLFASAFPAPSDAPFASVWGAHGKTVICHVGRDDQWLPGNQAVARMLAAKTVPVQFRVWENTAHQMPDNFTTIIVASIDSILCSQSPATSR